jgi:putative transcriptional regulator
MKTKSTTFLGRKRSRILAEVHETASGWYNAGLIDKRKMAEFELLCTPELPAYSPDRIRALRRRLNLSQAVLASVLNTSLSTIRQWEIGQRHPSGPSQKLLYILENKGLEGMT